MPNDFVPNHVITDHMGFNIANSLKDIASALNPNSSNSGSSGGRKDSPFLICNFVTDGVYPGGGEDPYADEYPDSGLKDSPIGSEQQYEDPVWIDKTAEQITDAIQRGCIVILRGVQAIEGNPDIEYGFNYGYSILTDCYKGIVGNASDNETVSLYQFEFRNIIENGFNLMFAKNQSDYPCSKPMAGLHLDPAPVE